MIAFVEKQPAGVCGRAKYITCMPEYSFSLFFSVSIFSSLPSFPSYLHLFPYSSLPSCTSPFLNSLPPRHHFHPSFLFFSVLSSSPHRLYRQLLSLLMQTNKAASSLALTPRASFSSRSVCYQTTRTPLLQQLPWHFIKIPQLITNTKLFRSQIKV